MSETGNAGLEEELEATLSALRENGAECFDPARFQIIFSMAGRARSLGVKAAGLVRKRALDRANDYQERLRREQARAEALAAEIDSTHQEHHQQAKALLVANQFAELRQLFGHLRNQAMQEQLGQLSKQLAPTQPTVTSVHNDKVKAHDFLRQQEFELTQSETAHESESAQLHRLTQQVQLRSAQECREALAQLEAEHLVYQASRAEPEDSGPLNPKKLAIRSLLTLQELSPGYLGRFVSYLDTLAWLEQID